MRRREPSIKSILITHIPLPTNLNLRQVRPRVKNPLAIFALKHRNRNAPRDLTANIPILKALQIINQHIFLRRREELNLVCLKMLYRHLSQLLHVHKPLLFQHRLNHCIAFITMCHRVNNLFFTSEQILLFQIFQNFLAALRRRKPLIFRPTNRQHLPLKRNHLYSWQIMSLAYFKIVIIMCRRNLYRPCSIFWIGMLISDNWNFSIRQR